MKIKLCIERKELEKLSHEHQVRFALFCCYQVEYLWKGSTESVKAVETTEAWLRGEASAEECRLAADAAAANAAYAANAADAAYAAAYAAADAANAADEVKEIQMNYLYELLYIDEILEERMLRA